MQSVYALLQSKSDDLDRQEKFLRASIERMYDLFAVLLQLLIEIRKNEENHISLAQKKYLATSDELPGIAVRIQGRLFHNHPVPVGTIGRAVLRQRGHRGGLGHALWHAAGERAY